MFSRRHPYLFFILIFTAMITGSSIVMSLLVAGSTDGYDDHSGEKIGVVEIVGVIADSKEIIDNLKKFREDKNIKAIVIRVDSPGGGVGPSQEIFRAIQKAKEKKKVITSMGALAASGGYYAAAATDGIMANPGTITGSIGVIMGYTNFQEIFNKIGLVPVVIKSGAYKDTGSPVRDMREDERKLLQGFVDKIHGQFVADVANGRGMEPDVIEKLADGRIYTGAEAKDLGLVDRLGNIEDAVEWAGELAGIKGKINVVYPPKPKLSFMEYLMESSMQLVSNRLHNANFNGGYIYQPGQ